MKNDIYTKVFMWLFVGLALTFGTGLAISYNSEAIRTITKTNFYWILILVELGVAIFLSVRIHKMQPTTAKICYLLYSFLTGLTFSTFFVVYKISSIVMVFGITAVLFLIFAIIGKITKLDLSKLGTYLLMLILGVIICSIINIFIGSSALDLGLCILSTVIFLGFIAYDVQKIQRMEGLLEEDNLAIFSAFQLYLDFINVFIDLIRIFGDAKD